MNARVLGEDGGAVGEAVLSDDIFSARVNVPLMHQVVTAQLAASRAGTHSTKTRGEVRGGGKKPYRQKGTGRARHGSIREPQWVGGGTAFGPKPRDHAQSVPKKMKALALRSALSARARDGRLLIVEDLAFEEPKTRRAIAALHAWSAEGKVLLVLAGNETAVAYSFRNLPSVHVIAEHQLNVYDVLNVDWVVFVRSALDVFQARAASLPRRNRNGGAGEPVTGEPPAEEPPAAQAAAGDEEVTTGA